MPLICESSRQDSSSKTDFQENHFIQLSSLVEKVSASCSTGAAQEIGRSTRNADKGQKILVPFAYFVAIGGALVLLALLVSFACGTLPPYSVLAK